MLAFANVIFNYESANYTNLTLTLTMLAFANVNLNYESANYTNQTALLLESSCKHENIF